MLSKIICKINLCKTDTIETTITCNGRCDSLHDGNEFLLKNKLSENVFVEIVPIACRSNRCNSLCAQVN